MYRARIWSCCRGGVAGLVVLGWGLLLSGCQRQDAGSSGKAGGDHLQQPQAERQEPLQPTSYRDWPKPEGVLVISGQQHGYLEPCGCSPQFQKGGLARRYACIQELRRRGWPVLPLELGGLLEDRTQQQPPGRFRIGPEQTEIKLQISLKALQLMGYPAMGIGPEDISVPDGFFGFLGHLVNIDDPPQPRGVNYNLGIDPAFIEQGAFHTFTTHQLGSVQVAVTAAVGKKFQQRIADSLLHWQDPQHSEAAGKTINQMVKGSDLQVLLFYGELDEAKQMARAFPDLDVIAYASRYEEPTGRAERVADTMLVTAGTKGKHVALVGLFSAAPQLRYELVSLDEHFRDDVSVAIRQLLDEEYLKELADRKLVQRAAKMPYDQQHPEYKFVGSGQCRYCHEPSYKKWKESKHARALETLKERGKEVNPECISCHTTGFLYQSGYDGTEATAHLGGVGCENCHGPGSWHVDILAQPQPRLEDYKRAIEMVKLPTPTVEHNVCTRCHDAENDPGFDLSKRWAEIVHPEQPASSQAAEEQSR